MSLCAAGISHCHSAVCPASSVGSGTVGLFIINYYCQKGSTCGRIHSLSPSIHYRVYRSVSRATRATHAIRTHTQSHTAHRSPHFIIQTFTQTHTAQKSCRVSVYLMYTSTQCNLSSARCLSSRCVRNCHHGKYHSAFFSLWMLRGNRHSLVLGCPS